MAKTKTAKAKKTQVKVRDLKPTKDAKRGALAAQVMEPAGSRLMTSNWCST